MEGIYPNPNEIYVFTLVIQQDIIAEVAYGNDAGFILRKPFLVTKNKEHKIVFVPANKINPLIKETITIPKTSIAMFYVPTDAAIKLYRQSVSGLVIADKVPEGIKDIKEILP